MKSFIAYYRVSTTKQGITGLGLEAQRQAVHAFLGHAPDREFIEVESGKRADNRPQLQAALDHVELTGSTLMIAKLDRLSRNAAFLMTLSDSGVDFVCADMPHANRLTIGIMALIAQEEREAISRRTKAALAIAKQRGTKLGGDRCGIARFASKAGLESARRRSGEARARAAKVLPYVAQARSAGLRSAREVAAYLNGQGVLTARGKTWRAGNVHRLLANE